MSEFIPVLEAPSRDAKWFIRNGRKTYTDDPTRYDGYSPCIRGSWQWFPGSVLCNCTGYAWGIFAKRENNKDCRIGCAPGLVYPGNAQEWVNNSLKQGYAVHSLPTLGAIAVWVSDGGTTGHVASVERILADGSWISGESGYGKVYGFVFRSVHYDAKSTKNGFQFLGFIWPKVPYDQQDPDALNVGDKVEIVAEGNGSSYGTANTAFGIGYKRVILNIYEGRPYPYQVGSKRGTTGFYTAAALRKID